MNEGEKNPVQILSKCADEFKQLADSMRVVSIDPRENDIPDIYDKASDLVSAIIFFKQGHDPQIDALKQAAEIDSRYLLLEKEFLKKMEMKMNDLAIKVEETQKEINTKMSNFQNEIDELPEFYGKMLKKIDEKSQDYIKELQLKLELEIEKAKEVERKCVQELEIKSKNEVEEYAQQWARRIKDADLEIDTLQKELQTAIHMKHQFIQVKNQELVFRSREIREAEQNYIKLLEKEKEAAAKENDELQIQLDELEKQVNIEGEKLNNLLEQQKLELAIKQQELEDQNDQQLVEITEEYDAVTRELGEKQTLLDELKFDQQFKVKESEKEAAERLKKIKLEIKEHLKKASHDIEAAYRPELLELTAQLQEAERERGLSLEELRKASLSSVEQGELEIIEINRLHQETRNKLLAIVRKEKQDLQEQLETRGESLEKLKSGYIKQIESQEKEFEENEIEHQKHLEELYALIAEQQRLFDEEQERKRIAREERRQMELKRLEDEHHNRHQAIMFKVDMWLKMESDRAYLAGVAEANEQHAREMGVLKAKIQAIKMAMDEQKRTYNALVRKCEQDLRRFTFDETEKFNEQIAQIKFDHESETKEVKDQYDELKKESDELKKDIDEMKEEINYLSQKTLITPETMSDELDHEFQTEVGKLKLWEAETTIQIRSLKTEVAELEHKNQTKKSELEEAENKLNDFNEHYDENYNNIINTTQSDYDKLIELERAKVKKFEEDSNKERKILTDQIEEYKKELDSITRSIDEKTKELNERRIRRLEEQEKELQKQHQEDIDNTMLNHNANLHNVMNKIEELKGQRASNLAEVNAKHEAEMKAEVEKYIKTKENIENEKKSLGLQIDTLRDKIKLEKTKVCPLCEEKEEQLAHLRAKRDEVQAKFYETAKLGSASDQKLNTIFQSGKQQRSTTSIAVPKPVMNSTTPLAIPKPTTTPRTALAGGRPRSTLKRPPIATPR